MWLEIEVLLAVNRWSSCIFFLSTCVCVCCWSIGFILVRYAFNAQCLFINLCTYLDNGVSTFFRDLPSPRFTWNAANSFYFINSSTSIFFHVSLFSFWRNSVLCLHFSDFVTAIAITKTYIKYIEIEKNFNYFFFCFNSYACDWISREFHHLLYIFMQHSVCNWASE